MPASLTLSDACGAAETALGQLPPGFIACNPACKMTLADRQAAHHPLDPKTVRVLRAVIRRMAKLRELTGDEFIFTNTDGGQWDRHTFARHLRRTAKRIGIDAGIIERVSATDMVSRVYAKTTRENPVHLRNVAGQIDDARRNGKAKKEPDDSKPKGENP